MSVIPHHLMTAVLRCCHHVPFSLLLPPPPLAHLDHIIIEVFGVPVDQVDLLGEDIMRYLLAVVCHDFVVGFVDVALMSDDGGRVEHTLGCRVEKKRREKADF